MNYLNLNQQEIDSVTKAIEERVTFYGYIPEKGFDFILKNYKALAERGVLEENWMLAYTHASHFENTTLDQIHKIFDSCNKEILQKTYPIYQGDHFSNGERFSLFRGCAGPEHKKGMSWTSSLDKAIWYAAKHAKYNDLNNFAVYAAVVERDEIYCCGNHYDYDFIVLPKDWWKIDVPHSEFKLNRPR